MPIAELYQDSASIGAVEYSCPADSTALAEITTDGVYQVFLDLSAMTAAETYRIRIYEKCRSVSTKRLIYESVIVGTSAPLWVSPSLLLMHGWDVTLQRLVGTDRTLEWSIRQVA